MLAHCVMLLCLGLLCLWAFVFPNTLLLAIDARSLRIPGVERRIIISLITYAVLSVVPASLLLGAVGGDMGNIAGVLSLSVLAALGFAILPRYIAVCFSVLPALSMGLKHALNFPGLDSPQLAYWVWPAVLILLVTDILRWRQMLRGDSHLAQGLSSTVVMQFRRGGAMGEWTVLCSPDMSGMIRNRPDWMQAAADLRKVGPQQPVKALRVALGGWYMPRTLGGYIRSLAPVLPPVLLVFVVMFLVRIADSDPSSKAWLGFGVGILFSIGTFGFLMVALTGVLSLRRRWVRVNSELPLMALLPGLGSTQQIKRTLLRACLLQPLYGQAVLWLIVLGTALAAHIRISGLLVMSLALFGCGGAMIALMLNTLSGRPLPTWMMGLSMVALFALLSVSLLLPALALGHHPWPAARAISLVLSGTWIVLGLGVAWFAHRDWRELLQRPHVFLANAQ
jgi:hypothetical protein